MEFFHNVNIDFLGKKWYFLAFSLIFSVAGVLSMLFWHGIPWGVDFRGGTLVYVKFSHTPDVGADPRRDGSRRPARSEDSALRPACEQRSPDRSSMCARPAMTGAGRSGQDARSSRRWKPMLPRRGKQDLNNASSLTIKNYLMDKDPLHLGAPMPTRNTPRRRRRLLTIAIRSGRRARVRWIS